MADQQNPNLIHTVYGAAPLPQAAEKLEPGTRFADFEIIRELGAGGMGVVYLAKETLSQDEVVLKLIHPALVDDASRERMIAEGRIARGITNPYVVRIYHIGEHQGQIFLSMEHVTGRPLRSWIAENLASGKDAPLADVLKITHEILVGLAAAHDVNVVHRDLKPENIMIDGAPSDPDFKLKILDFGIARGLKPGVLTGSSAPMGSRGYMAPEQETTPDAAGPSADIFSVGRILYQMLMDVLPPDGVATPPPPSEQRSDVPKAMDAVIAKALSPRPKSRFQTVAEFAAALDNAAQGTSVAEVSSNVWRMEGGDALLDSLTKLDATITERLGPGYQKFDKAVGEQVGGLMKKAGLKEWGEVVSDRQNADPELKKKAMKWSLIVVGVLVGLWVLATALESSGGGDVGGGGGGGGGLDVSGAWYLQDGQPFQVSQNGDFITGRGIVNGLGAIAFEGPLNGRLTVVSLETGAEIGVMQGGMNDNAHWAGTVQFYGGGGAQVFFHINHRNH